jgi:HK97 family phage portal protein
MSLIGRIINGLSVTDPKAWSPSLWNLIGAQSHSGVKVDEQSALCYSAVFCAVNLLAGTISTLPLRLLQEKGNKKELAAHKPVHRVMHTQWNKYMTAQVGREVMAAHVLTWGNGYAEKVMNGRGEIAGLWPIPPNRVRPEMVDGELIYIIDVDGHQVIMPREKILHVPGLGFDGFMGYSVVALARESIGLGMAQERFGANYFGNGTHPGVIVSHPGKLTEQGSRNLQESLVAKYSGLGNSHRLLLLEEAMKIEKISFSPEDSQFLESRQFQIPEIARWFNLPPHKLKDLTRSSFSNIESEQISFVTESILPWVVRYETNFNMQLLSEREQKEGYFFKHSLEGMLRGDNKSRAEFYAKMFGIGAMNINEIRGKEDLDPIEGGDRHFVPLNMAALDKFDEEKQNDNQPTPPDEQKDEPAGEQNRRGNALPL